MVVPAKQEDKIIEDTSNNSQATDATNNNDGNREKSTVAVLDKKWTMPVPFVIGDDISIQKNILFIPRGSSIWRIECSYESYEIYKFIYSIFYKIKSCL